LRSLVLDEADAEDTEEGAGEEDDEAMAITLLCGCEDEEEGAEDEEDEVCCVGSGVVLSLEYVVASVEYVK
jgi:hypothetical protein